MQKTLKLILRTREAELVKKDVESVYLTSEAGDLVLLPGHSALSATLTYSPIVIKDGQTEETYLSYGGVVFFSNAKNECHILAQRADLKDRVDYDGLKSYLKLVQERIENGEDLSDIHMRYLEGERVALVEGIEAEGK